MTVVASNYARQANDLYQTEPWVTAAILRNLPSMAGRPVWEPFAGNHLMADVLREHGARVCASDIATYDRHHDFILDFFEGRVPPLEDDYSIISNPPYGKSNRDAERAARLCLRQCSGYIALVLTANFDSGSTRVDLFRDNARFFAKIVLIDRIKWFPGTDGEGTGDHAVYIWGPAPGIGRGSAKIIYEGRRP